jgi:hypothetical protein
VPADAAYAAQMPDLLDPLNTVWTALLVTL